MAKKDEPARKEKRPPFASYAEAKRTADDEGYRIVEEIRTKGTLRLNVVKGARPETWRVER